jgi:hypothetical protein
MILCVHISIRITILYHLPMDRGAEGDLVGSAEVGAGDGGLVSPSTVGFGVGTSVDDPSVKVMVGTIAKAALEDALATRIPLKVTVPEPVFGIMALPPPIAIQSRHEDRQEHRRGVEGGIIDQTKMKWGEIGQG